MLKIEKEGEINLWLNNENEYNQRINVSFGRVYFVKYMAGERDWVGHPKLSLQNTNEGYAESAQLRVINPEQ